MHLFISYKHEDIYQRNALIRTLNEANIPYWADVDINAGEGWREAIDEALENAFAIAIVLTPRSMTSPYVIYEWSWAMGHGVPVIPLLFEPIASQDIHARLSTLQLVNCTETIPNDLVQTIARYQLPSPASFYTEVAISDVVMPLRFYLKLAAWLYEYSENNSIYPASGAYNLARESLIFEFFDLRRNQLPKLWTQVMPLSTRYLRHKAEKLTLLLDGLLYEFYDVDRGQDALDMIGLKQEWEATIDPLLRGFHGYENPSLVEFETKLQAIPSESHLIWDAKTRGHFAMFKLTSPFDRLSTAVAKGIQDIFAYLYTMTSPEILEELLNEIERDRDVEDS